MRSTRLAALTVAVTLALSGLALAGDHDRYKDKHDHYKDDHYKHDHYKDKHEDHHDWGHIFNHDRDRDRDRERENHHWWESSREKEREHDRWEREHGNVTYGSPVYNRYPGGYGYPSSGYPVGSVYGRGGYGGGGAGYRQGMEDGSYQARKDISQGKPFNPNPRGSSHSDHGYNSSMGDKHVYQASYDQGYHSGYQANYGGGGRRGWGF